IVLSLTPLIATNHAHAKPWACHPVLVSGLMGLSGLAYRLLGNSHGIERPPDEDEGDGEHCNADVQRKVLRRPKLRGLFGADGDFYREQAEEGGELDDGVEGDGGSVLE